MTTVCELYGLSSFGKCIASLAVAALLVVTLGCSNTKRASSLSDDSIFRSVPADEIGPYDPNEDILALTSVTKDDARAARERLKSNPADLRSRVRLMSFLTKEQFSDASAKEELGLHSLWFATNAPGSSAAGSPFTHVDQHDRRYDEILEVWKETVENNPKDRDILGNAASYFTVWDREFSLKCLEKGREAYPEEYYWLLSIAQLHSLDITGDEGSKQRANPARKAFDAQTKGLALLANQEGFRDSLEEADALSELALYAYESDDLEQAAKICSTVIQRAQRDKERLADEYHAAHQVLGRIALRNGDLASAGKHLIESVNVPGSPVLNSFGPDLRLAKLVALAGDKKSVTQYFQACLKLADKQEYKTYLQELQAGEQPSISPFAR